jgi:hypothetical protein
MKLKDLQAALSNPETVNKVVASKTSAVASNRTKAPDQSRAAKTGGLSVLAENDNSFAASKGATQRDTLKFFAPKISTAAKEAAKEQKVKSRSDTLNSKETRNREEKPAEEKTLLQKVFAPSTRDADATFGNGIEEKKPRAEKVNVGKLIQGTILKGADTVVAPMMKTANDILGGPAQEIWNMFGLNRVAETNPLTAAANAVQKGAEQNQKYFADNSAKSKVAATIDKYGTMTMAALPMAAVALLTGGTSASAALSELGIAGGMGTTEGLAAASELAQAGKLGKDAATILQLSRTAITNMFKDPNYWTAFAQASTDSYQQAKDAGANESQAALMALTNGTLNAAVEIGGGMQVLPSNVRKLMEEGGGKISWKSFAKSIRQSAAEEGIEEPVQDTVQNALANVTYGAKNPLFSTTNPNAIINPKQMAQEAFDAGVVGALLGGGQIGVMQGAKAAGAAVKTAVGDRVVGSAVMQNDQHAALVGAALQYREGSKTKALADQINQKLSAETYTGGDAFNGVTEAEFGKLQRTAAEELEQYGPTTQTPTQRAAVAQTVNPDAHVMSPIAAEFQSAGLTADDAVRRGDVLDRLLSTGGAQTKDGGVSNRELDTLLNVSDTTTQEVFKKITGTSFDTTGATKAQIRNAFRKAASMYQTARAEKAAEVEKQGKAIAAAQQAVEEARAKVHTEAQQQAAQMMNDAVAQSGEYTEAEAMHLLNALSQGSTNTEETITLPKSGKTVTKAEFFQRAQENAQARGVDITPDQIEELYQQTKARTAPKPAGNYSVEELAEPTEKQTAKGAKISDEQRLTARFVAEVTKNYGITNVVFDDTMTQERASILGDTLTLNPKKLKTQQAITWAIGHELTHPSIDADPKMTNNIIELFQNFEAQGALSDQMAEQVNGLDALVDKKIALYKKFLVERKGMSQEEVDAQVTPDYARAEIAADWMGNLFRDDHLMMQFAGVKPSLIVRAINAAYTVGERWAGRADAEADKNIDKQIQRTAQRMRDALSVAAQMNSGHGIVRNAVVADGIVNMTWAEQVDTALDPDGDWDGMDALYLKTTPSILRKIGLKDLPVCMTQLALINANLPETRQSGGHSHGHDVGKTVLRSLPEILADPLMVIDGGVAAQHPGTITVITDKLHSDGRPYAITIRPAGSSVVDGIDGPANVITTVFPVDSFFKPDYHGDRFIDRMTKNDKILYVSKEKSQKVRYYDKSLYQVLRTFGFTDSLAAADSDLAESLATAKGQQTGTGLARLAELASTFKSGPALEFDKIIREYQGAVKGAGPKRMFSVPTIDEYGRDLTDGQNTFFRDSVARVGYTTSGALQRWYHGARPTNTYMRSVLEPMFNARGGYGIFWTMDPEAAYGYSELDEKGGDDSDLVETSFTKDEEEPVSKYSPEAQAVREKAWAKDVEVKDLRADISDLQLEVESLFEDRLDAMNEGDFEGAKELDEQREKVQQKIRELQKKLDTAAAEHKELERQFNELATRPRKTTEERKNFADSTDRMGRFAKKPSSKEGGHIPARGGEQRIYECYLNLKNPYVVDCQGHHWDDLWDVTGGKGWGTDSVTKYIHENTDYDGVIFRNIVDGSKLLTDVAVTFDASQSKSTANTDPTISKDLRFSIDETITPPFYSKMEQELENVKQDKLGAASVEAMLKGKGVKDEEIKWSGIRTFLDGKKSVTKQELLDYVKSNRLEVATDVLEDDKTHFAKYTTPGGSKYQEILYRLPNSGYTNGNMQIHWGGEGILAHTRVQDFVDADGKKVLFVDEIQSDWHNSGKKYGYETAGQAKARSEAQSISTELKALVKEYKQKTADGTMTPEIQDALSSKNNELRGALRALRPDYDATGIALNEKREALAKRAATKSIGKIMDYYRTATGEKNETKLLTNLATQVEKNVEMFKAAGFTSDDLADYRTFSKEVDEYFKLESAYKGTGFSDAVPDAPFRDTIPEISCLRICCAKPRRAATISSHGRPLRCRLTAGAAEVRGRATASNTSRTSRKFLNKYGKQWGAKVGTTEIVSDGKAITVPSIDVTPEMEDSILRKGQPLYSLDEKAEDVPDSRKDTFNHKLTKGMARFMKDSVMREGNTTSGRLIVMYRGTDAGKDYMHTPTWWSSRPETSRTYAHSNPGLAETNSWKRIKSLEAELASVKYSSPTRAKEIGKELRAEHAKIEQYAKDIVRPDKRYPDSTYPKSGNVNAIYECYLNLTHPYILDARGHVYNDLYDPISNRSVTDDVVKWAQQQYNSDGTRKYDGVIFNDIVDSLSPGMVKGDERGIVAVTFDSNQAKSTKNTQPTDDRRMAYSLDEDVDTERDDSYNGSTEVISNGAEAGTSDNRGRQDSGRAEREGPDGRGNDTEHAGRGSDGRGNLAVFQRQLTEAGIADAGVVQTDDYAAFSAALEKARAANKHGQMVDSQSVENLTANRTKTFLSPDGGAGVAVEDSGNIVGLFKNGEINHTPRAVQSLLLTAIREGGDHLDCYMAATEPSLVSMYTPGGCVPVAWLKFSREYAPDGWNYKVNGEPDVVMMVHNGDSIEEILRNMSQYKSWTPKEIHALPEFTDYEKAKAYQAEQLDKVKAARAEKAGAVSTSTARYTLDEDTTPELDEMFNSYFENFYRQQGYKPSVAAAQEGRPATKKTSRVASNTFKKSNVFTDAEKTMKEMKPGNNQYDVVTEQQSMRRAVKRLQTDYAGEKTNLPKKAGGWGGEDLDTAMGILGGELRTARTSDNYADVLRWAKTIRRKGTQAGQMIQAFAKYSRTPEGVLIRAAEDLEKTKLPQDQKEQILKNVAHFAKNLENMQSGDRQGLIDIILQQAKMRGTPVSKTTLRNLGMQKFDYLYDAAMNQLDQIAKDYIRLSVGKKIATYQTLSHLLNMRTALRNVISNQVFDIIDSAANDASLIPDAIMSTITGTRTVGFEKSWASSAKRKGAMAGLRRAWIEASLDISPEPTTRDKYGTARRTWKMTGGAASKTMSTLEKAMGFELNVADEFHKGSVAAEVTESLAKFVENGSLTQEQAEEFARQEALYRSFQDDTWIGSRLGEIKDGLNTIGVGSSGRKTGHGGAIHDFGLGDLVQKYTQVPGALLTRAIEFSPLGYLKAIDAMAKIADARKNGEVDASNAEAIAAQRRSALSMGRATTGTGLIAAFVTAALAGLLKRADDEDDPDARALNTAEGISGTQWNASAFDRLLKGESIQWRNGDVLLGIDFLEPLNSLMTMGALVAKAESKNAKGLFLDATSATFGSLTNSVADLPTMQTVKTIWNTIQYKSEDDSMSALLWKMGVEIAASSATGFVPALVRQTAQATDAVSRDAYTTKDPLQQLWASMKNSVPGARNELPATLTNFGERRKRGGARDSTRPTPSFTPGSLRTYKRSAEASRARERSIKLWTTRRYTLTATRRTLLKPLR